MHIRKKKCAVLRLTICWNLVLLEVGSLIVLYVLKVCTGLRLDDVGNSGRKVTIGGAMLMAFMYLIVCGFHYDFYDDGLVCRWFGIPFRRVPWNKVDEVGLINGGRTPKGIRECIKTGDAHIIMTLNAKVHFRPDATNFKKVIRRATRFFIRHPLSTVVIMPLEKKDVSRYIDFVLQHTGKKLSFGDPNEGTEGDVQDTHPAEQPNDLDEK